MSVVAPPRRADVDERSLDERVAELEALIEEARRRARRRRQRNAAVVAAGRACRLGGDLRRRRRGAGRLGAFCRHAVPAARQLADRIRALERPVRAAGLLALGDRRRPPDLGERLRRPPACASSAARTAAGAGAPGGPLDGPARRRVRDRSAAALDPLRGHRDRRVQERRRGTQLEAGEHRDQGRSDPRAACAPRPRRRNRLLARGRPHRQRCCLRRCGRRGHVSKIDRRWKDVAHAPGISILGRALAIDPADPETLLRRRGGLPGRTERSTARS